MTGCDAAVTQCLHHRARYRSITSVDEATVAWIVDRAEGNAFALEDLQGTHALGHTRMATESRVTTEHSHPFSTGLDLCLVHNGSLSNHNRLRENLKREEMLAALPEKIYLTFDIDYFDPSLVPATGTPSTLLFGPTDPVVWSGWNGLAPGGPRGAAARGRLGAAGPGAAGA